MRSALLWALALILLVGTAGWFAVSCGGDRAAAERPVTEEEAELLAALRYRNHTSAPVALRMTYPVGADDVTVDGYLDWRNPLLYARAPGPDGQDRLVQAIPGLVATHADDEAFDEADAPESGWSPRQMLAGDADASETALDVLASSLFTLSADKGDDPGLMAERATWRDDGVIDGDAVDTFRAPIMVESEDPAAAAPEALYSLDGSGDLRRFQINTGEDRMATVDFLYGLDFDAARLHPIDLLGGPAIEPGAVDDDMADTIAQVRHANWSQSATVELTVPVADGQVAEGRGFIDWRSMTAYVNVSDAQGHRLVLARPGGLATLATDDDELPEPLPDEGWETRPFGTEATTDEFGTVETMVYRLLEMSSAEAEDSERIADEASQLRVDESDGATVHVVEFPVAGDAHADAGQSAFRYHIADERLAEVEMMTYYGVASAALEYEDYPMVAIPWTVAEVIG